MAEFPGLENLAVKVNSLAEGKSFEEFLLKGISIGASLILWGIATDRYNEQVERIYRDLRSEPFPENIKSISRDIYAGFMHSFYKLPMVKGYRAFAGVRKIA